MSFRHVCTTDIFSFYLLVPPDIKKFIIADTAILSCSILLLLEFQSPSTLRHVFLNAHTIYHSIQMKYLDIIWQIEVVLLPLFLFQVSI